MKITLNKLKLKKVEEDFKTIYINDVEVKVRTYLPSNLKAEMITKILEQSVDSTNHFSSPVRVEVFTNLNIVSYYTDISFTEKQLDSPNTLYDLLEVNRVFEEVIAAIGENEYNILITWIEEAVNNYYSYKNSALGILETISADYSNLSLDADAIRQKLADAPNLDIVKNVITKLA